MKIEAGKCYKSRSGKKIGPMVHDQGSESCLWDCEETDLSFTAEGFCLCAKDGSSDLIEEWVDDDLVMGEVADEPKEISNKPRWPMGSIALIEAAMRELGASTVFISLDSGYSLKIERDQ